MFWVKDVNGNLVNLGMSRLIVCIPPQVDVGGTFEVRSYDQLEDSWSLLFVGKREECGRYRDDLFARLKEFQEADRV